MKPIAPASGISRRTLLSTIAALPAVAGPLGSAPASAQTAASNGMLPSWNDGPAKQAIVDFLRATTDSSSASYVRPEGRIAVFDQDGTLWVEHPLYTQAMFALERVRGLAPEHPDWKSQDPFAAVLSGDEAAVAHFSEKDWTEIIGATHAGMSNEAFLEIVKRWLATARHPRGAGPSRLPGPSVSSAAPGSSPCPARRRRTSSPGRPSCRGCADR